MTEGEESNEASTTWAVERLPTTCWPERGWEPRHAGHDPVGCCCCGEKRRSDSQSQEESPKKRMALLPGAERHQQTVERHAVLASGAHAERMVRVVDQDVDAVLGL